MAIDHLERDLKTLAERRPDDERLRLAIRASLGERVQVRPGPRRRRRLLVGSAAVATATLAAASVALVGTGSSGGPAAANAAILAQAARAVSPPPNLIVHIKETGVQRDGTPVSAEWWQATNPPYAIRLIKGSAARPVEAAADGTTSSEFEADTNTIYRQSDSTSPRLIDPIETIRAALADGTAQVDGTVTIGGRRFYRIDLPDGVVGYFDQTDYRPVYLDNPQRDGSVVRTQVVAYDELAVTAENEKLLSITAQHPDASVETGLGPKPAK